MRDGFCVNGMFLVLIRLFGHAFDKCSSYVG